MIDAIGIAGWWITVMPGRPSPEAGWCWAPRFESDGRKPLTKSFRACFALSLSSFSRSAATAQCTPSRAFSKVLL